jgi:hypothetical protein
MARINKPNKLRVIAIDEASVRQVEPDGTILPDIRIVGKTITYETRTHRGSPQKIGVTSVIPGGVEIQYSAHYVQQLKLGTLLPADQATATLAGVPFNKGN